MCSVQRLVLYHQFTRLGLSMVAISLVARWFGGEVTGYHTTNEVPADQHSHLIINFVNVRQDGWWRVKRGILNNSNVLFSSIYLII